MKDVEASQLSVSRLVGKNVARIRDELAISQRDLEVRLSSSPAQWTRTAVGMLESRGIRGERLSDLVELCIALDQPLIELLAGDGDVLLQDGTRLALESVRRALFESRESEQRPGEQRAQKVGVDDPKESARLARSINSSEALLDWIEKVTSKPPSLSSFRDFLGDVSPADSRKEARRKRISGTHQLKVVADSLEEMSSPGAYERAVETWRSWSAAIDGEAGAGDGT